MPAPTRTRRRHDARIAVRGYWFACQRGRVPAENPIDALSERELRRVMRYGGRVAYEVYLRSQTWRMFRLAMIDRAHGTCQGCGADERASVLLVLDVHHLTYERLGCERPDDVMVLCRGCHEAEHGRV